MSYAELERWDAIIDGDWSRGFTYGWPSDDDQPPDILDQIDAALALIPTKDLSRPANPDQPWPYTSF